MSPCTGNVVIFMLPFTAIVCSWWQSLGLGSLFSVLIEFFDVRLNFLYRSICFFLGFQFSSPEFLLLIFRSRRPLSPCLRAALYFPWDFQGLLFPPLLAFSGIPFRFACTSLILFQAHPMPSCFSFSYLPPTLSLPSFLALRPPFCTVRLMCLLSILNIPPII